MPRNTAGTYALPSTTNPVVADTYITPDWANGTLGDLAGELTDSLSRSGKGGMSAPLMTPDGSVGTPAHTFTSEPSSGWFRHASAVIRAAVAGVWRLSLDATGAQVNGNLSVTGTLSATGKLDRPSLPATGQQVSASSGTFNRSLNTRTAVTNLSVTLTTTGRPVMVFLQPDGTANLPQFGASGSDNAATARFYLVRTDNAAPPVSTDLSVAVVSSTASSTVSGTICMVPPASLAFLDVVAAGTYTYTIEARTEAATNMVAYCQYTKLAAFEL